MMSVLLLTNCAVPPFAARQLLGDPRSPVCAMRLVEQGGSQPERENDESGAGDRDRQISRESMPPVEDASAVIRLERGRRHSGMCMPAMVSAHHQGGDEFVQQTFEPEAEPEGPRRPPVTAIAIEARNSVRS